MSIAVDKEHFHLTPEEQASAEHFISGLRPDVDPLRTTDGGRLPEPLANVIAAVFRAIREDLPITVSTLPREVTTTTAASMLDVSRPTLMKYIRNGDITAHKVGAHHRLSARDVLDFAERLKERRRNAVFALLDAEEELADGNPTTTR